MPATTATAMEVGAKLLNLCKEGKNLEAVDTLYADDIVSVELMDCPEMDMPRIMNGIEAVRGKNVWWLDNHEVHSCEFAGPFPHDERFVITMKLDCTCNAPGPMQGQRMQMEEACVYTLNDAGKIAKEEFFYHMPG
tara:strand:+ start:947 stop:1354 length:408 start_codon:yes stop_codon:yes gene_type:complete